MLDVPALEKIGRDYDMIWLEDCSEMYFIEKTNKSLREKRLAEELNWENEIGSILLFRLILERIKCLYLFKFGRLQVLANKHIRQFCEDTGFRLEDILRMMR